MVWRFFVLIFFIPIVYGFFGWVIADHSISWSHGLQYLAHDLDIGVSVTFLSRIIYIAAAVSILVIVLALTIFNDQVSLLFRSWFKNDVRVFICVLGWSLAVVFILRWLSYSAQLACLLAAAILGKIELQEAGLRKNFIFPILLIMCLGTYILGLYAHGIFNHLF
ncbi:MAG: hypothetical protein N5P05_002856 [Chroococcopsis gigantea SAG 12.99]|jgi:hypothetical protein|nr:hypothetical protein [Chlorogloea purpurea SAG 13.99]MDV3001250.1 hypothetical protein [Chroococcopsis gigantea SAG 12.99]